MADKIGRRCEFSGHFGTVRYFGEVKATVGTCNVFVFFLPLKTFFTKFDRIREKIKDCKGINSSCS